MGKPYGTIEELAAAKKPPSILVALWPEGMSG
jgi:hypothetical protein